MDSIKCKKAKKEAKYIYGWGMKSDHTHRYKISLPNDENVLKLDYGDGSKILKSLKINVYFEQVYKLCLILTPF